MDKRRKRALLWTLAILTLVSGPLLFQAWLISDAGKVAIPNLGHVEPFVLRDVEDQPITKEILYQAVVIVVNIPQSCAGSSCPLAQAQAKEISLWIQDQLKIGYTEEKNPLHLISTGGGFTPPTTGWRIVSAPAPAGGLIPESYDPNTPWLVVIDPWLVFAGAWDLTKPIDRKTLQRVLSRTTFEQYLGNYLARRTFMGPRRDL